MYLKFSLALMLALASVVALSKPYTMDNTDSVVLEDKKTNRKYEVFIRVPERYDQAKKYPVVYLTDAWNRFPIVAAAVQIPILTGSMEGVIVVGISKDVNEDRDDARVRDFTPTSPTDWKKKSGEADTYHSFVSGVLFDYIDRSYSTDPKNRTYVGGSLGGLWGAYVLFKYPETFNNYILASPALWFDNYYIFGLEKQFLEKAKNSSINVYLSVGELEVIKSKDFNVNMVKDAERLYDVLNNKKIGGLRVKNVVVDSANHDVSFPTSSIMGLFWLFSGDS
ncbi:alpha/beta hydrolase [Teredinibacter franksiae]|uniref:alpha/beta hydrolase n=1 Tax=Teredinibacter franksiae TaxID=2761453 RepID=UPI00162AEB6C|nr:alpha/beta hydrolase-fold protein [Teredinibacter franksiae]